MMTALPTWSDSLQSVCAELSDREPVMLFQNLLLLLVVAPLERDDHARTDHHLQR